MNDTYIIETSKHIPVIYNHFNRLQYVIRATSKDETRRNLKCVHIQDGIYYGTDGHRLHVYSPDCDNLPVDYIIPDGNYDVLTNNKKQIIFRLADVDFPDIDRILSYRRHNGIDPFMASNDPKNHNFYLFTYYVITQTEQAFNLDYLRDAIFTGELIFDRTTKEKGGMSPLVIGNDSQFAMIMPLKV